VTPRARRTAAKRPTPERIVFRGPPDRLASLLPPSGAPVEEAAAPAASLRGAEVRGLSVRRQARAGTGERRATLRLPRSTPPGTYRGSAEIGGEQVPIVAQVESRPRIEAEPRRLELEAGPGETVTVEVTLLNTGNVPFDLSGATEFCVFDGRGVEHAFWAALATDPPEGKQRIDVLLDDLAESHGGLVTVKVADGGVIEPGESHAATLTLRFSDRLRPGKRYAGSWRADGLRLAVRVTTPATKPRRAARARR
jgi:hypothetical protein